MIDAGKAMQYAIFYRARAEALRSCDRLANHTTVADLCSIMCDAVADCARHGYEATLRQSGNAHDLSQPYPPSVVP